MALLLCVKRIIFVVTIAGLLSSLIKAGANVAPNDKVLGSTAHRWAAIRGHTEVIKALIKAGADIDAKNNEGNTARAVALNKGYSNIVALLEAAKKQRG